MNQDQQVTEDTFEVGEPVEKIGGDYTFIGSVRSVFTKISGVIRYVVEDDRGVLHVYSRKNLRRKMGATKHLYKEVAVFVVQLTGDNAGFHCSIGEKNFAADRPLIGPFETEQAALDAAIAEIDSISKELDAEEAKFGFVSEEDVGNTLASAIRDSLGVLGNDLKNGNQEKSN